ncbi:cysteine peptidase family C39 domain-containing protein [Pelagibaculum spongiae]|uniref:ABC transporter ATP-binding protein n=1 Tax=Pelagibaculum spongiae TaxID=2080658 RepID=A0A2V1GYT0_9GAMM|nr:cysteine peptidase family C39 domain-containing protein [Pelagibaculum spongiae]PVZ72231.1 hypothetical protein DC094_04250 [Pelagibaculum spongiae]
MSQVFKTPARIQASQVDCGSTCLGIILEHAGCVIGSYQLRRLCGVSRDGASIANIQRGAQTLGCQATVIKRGVKRLESIEHPVVVHWNLNHFVVLEGLTADQAWINDPASGRRVISSTEFCNSYTGLCIDILAPETIDKSTPESVIKQFPGMLKTLRYLVIISIFPAIIVFLFELGFGGIKRGFFDYAIDYSLSGWGVWLGFSGLILLLVKSVFNWIYQDFKQSYQQQLFASFNHFFIQKISQRSLRFFETYHPDELIFRLSEASQYLQLCMVISSSIAEQLLLLAACSAILYLIDPLFLLLGLMPFLLLTVWAWCIRFKLRELSLKLQIESSNYHAKTSQQLQSQQRYYAMGLQKYLFSAALIPISRVVACEAEKERALLLYQSVSRSLTSLSPAIFTFGGGLLLAQGKLSYGSFLLAESMALLLLVQLQIASQQIQQFFEMQPFARRAGELLKDEQFECEQPIIASNEVDICSGSLISARQMGFGYNGVDSDLFRQVSLDIESSVITGFSGSSGCGKTTLMEVLSGQRQPVIGQVYFKGSPLHSNAPVGYVFAEEDVSGTLQQYISSGQLVDNEKICWVLKQSELWSRVGFLLQHDKPLLLESLGLSRGEKQRLALARALYFSQECIFFDEAFSHLSLTQSYRIIERLRGQGVALVLATHRHEILKLCDCIIDIEKFSNIDYAHANELG